MRGDDPSGLLTSQERREGGKSGKRQVLVAGLPRLGTAPLDSCFRRNDARGGGQERWGEWVRFHPTRAREEVSRPSLIHLWISQKGERRIGSGP